MRAGTLRERIDLELSVPSTDAQWGPVEEWQQYASSVPASVLAAGAGEKVQDKGVGSSTRFNIRIRFRGDVKAAHRVIWRGRTLDILGLTDPDGRRRELVIEAIEHGQ